MKDLLNILKEYRKHFKDLKNVLKNIKNNVNISNTLKKSEYILKYYIYLFKTRIFETSSLKIT